jgi:cellulose synthase (UDP-forming)
MAASLGIGACYLIYRGQHTLNPDAWAFSIVVYVVEVWAFLALALFFHEIWPTPKPASPPAAPSDLSVDVLIVTHDEDVELVRSTVLAALGMAHPHKTCVLDDGSRPAVARLAQDLGVDYITRPDYAYGTAGNINHGLTQTTGDVAAVFEAGHVPRPDFLERTLGFFMDPGVAVVQTPPHFYAQETVNGADAGPSASAADAQALVSSVEQPARHAHGAAVLEITCALVRRAAMQDIGGLPVQTSAEGLHASLLLHERGWKTVYVQEPLAVGLRPAPRGRIETQRTRLAMGALHLFLACNPLLLRGLTLRQRLAHLSQLFRATLGIQRIAYYLVPPLMLLTPLSPAKAVTPDLLAFFAAALVARWLACMAATSGRARLMADEYRYVLNAGLYVRTLLAAATGAEARLPDRRPSASAAGAWAPQAVLFLLAYTALLWAGLEAGHQVDQEPYRTAFGAFWSFFYGLLGGAVVVAALLREERRRDDRYRAMAPVTYRLSTDPTETERVAMACDYSASGMALLTYEPIPIGEDFQGALLLDLARLPIQGRVLYLNDAISQADAAYGYGVQFVDLDAQARYMLSRQSSRQDIPAMLGTDGGQGRGLLWALLSRRGRRLGRWAGLPINLDPRPGNWRPARLLDLHGLTARVLTASEPEMPARTSFILLSPFGLVRGAFRVTRASQARYGSTTCWEWTVYVETLDPESAERMSRLSQG